MNATIAIQEEAAHRFLTLLFAPYAESRKARVEIRCFRSGRGTTIQHWYDMSPDGMANAARAAQRYAGALDVYCTVLPRREGLGDAKGLRLGAWLWADVDGGEGGPQGSLALLKAAADKGLPRPNMVVVSGGGVHAYWRLAEPVPCYEPEDRDRLRSLLRRLVIAIGGSAPEAHADRASAEPARILRVPGTFNYKRDRPRPVTLLRADEAAPVYPDVWWRAHLPPEPLPPQSKRQRRRDRQTAFDFETPPPVVRTKIETPTPPGSRHYAMRDVAVWARKRGLPEEEVRRYAERVGSVSGVPMNHSDQQRHLDDLVRWTMTTVQPEGKELILCD